MGYSRTFGFKILSGFGLLVTAIIINTVVSHSSVTRIRDTQTSNN